ncbi:MAG: hypothetical protein ACI4ES_16430 [Roseburia sp.]
MIKQLKMGFKLMKYAYGLKSCLIAGAFFMVLGILQEYFWEIGNQATGALFILITAMWPLQLLYSINAANVTQASPCKKKIQTSVSAITGFVSFLLMYLVVLGIFWMKYKTQTITEEQAVMRLIMLNISIVVLMIYMAVALKYFWVSTVVFLIVFMATTFGFQIVSYNCPECFGGISIEAASLMGVAAVVLGTFLQYGISILLYKKPVSKYSQIASLRKKM